MKKKEVREQFRQVWKEVAEERRYSQEIVAHKVDRIVSMLEHIAAKGPLETCISASFKKTRRMHVVGISAGDGQLYYYRRNRRFYRGYAGADPHTRLVQVLRFGPKNEAKLWFTFFESVLLLNFLTAELPKREG